jgi:histidinol dehydrogenase
MSELLPLIRATNTKQAASKIRGRRQGIAPILKSAERIVRTTKEGGDRALCRYSEEIDRVKLSPKDLRVGRKEISDAVARVDPKLLDAMGFALKRIRRTQGQLLERIPFSYVSEGFVIRSTVRPLDSVGCYVPGGRASYASTVLMTAGVAKLAGVRRVVVCTPPSKDGRVGDAILAAADLCGVDEVYRVGGAQAVAALAYGTETIKKVSKIVGPGGVYVSAAKKLVSVDVPIDFVAGPTELVVVGDSKTDARLAAWDLMGQAEHGKDSVCGLVTWDKGLAGDVRAFVERTVPTLERRDHVEGCLRNGFVALCRDRDAAVGLVNELAPEHLELLVEDAGEMAKKVENAGLVLVGPFAPAAASDYAVGTDHVLPTEGVATQRAGLTSLDFVKVSWVVEGTKAGLRSVLPAIKELANAEGLPNHYLSVRSRFRR